MQFLTLSIALSILSAVSAKTVYVTQTHFTTVFGGAPAVHVETVRASTIEVKVVTVTYNPNAAKATTSSSRSPTTLVTKTSPTTTSVPKTTTSPTTTTKAITTTSPITTVKPTTTTSPTTTAKPTTTTSPTTTAKPTTTSIVTPTTSSLATTTVQKAVAPTTTSSKKTSSTTSTAAAAATSSSSGIYAEIAESSGLDASFAKSILDAHNVDRAAHSAPNLSWSKEVYEYAQAYADKYDCSGILTHSGGKYGENLAVGYSSGVTALEAWYGEGSTYDYSTANSYDHFTQVVWKSTTKLGCAYKDCSAENWGKYVICSYDPAGNIIGYNSKNVFQS